MATSAGEPLIADARYVLRFEICNRSAASAAMELAVGSAGRPGAEFKAWANPAMDSLLVWVTFMDRMTDEWLLIAS